MVAKWYGKDIPINEIRALSETTKKQLLLLQIVFISMH
jgi:hypothetical protein